MLQYAGPMATGGREALLAEDLAPDAYEAIRQLMRLVAANGLAELTVSQPDGFSVTVKATVDEPVVVTTNLPAVISHSPASLAHSALAQPLHAPFAATAKPARPARKARPSSAIPMVSPMVGIYYEAPAPGEPPFIKVGDVIHVGTVIGLIEAMKVYSEVPSEVAGRVVELSGKNGVLVQQGEPLFYVEPE
jgi:acetyl-CoA carboxylase biotin carboxyl carrier protein